MCIILAANTITEIIYNLMLSILYELYTYVDVKLKDKWKNRRNSEQNNSEYLEYIRSHKDLSFKNAKMRKCCIFVRDIHSYTETSVWVHTHTHAYENIN